MYNKIKQSRCDSKVVRLTVNKYHFEFNMRIKLLQNLLFF